MSFVSPDGPTDGDGEGSLEPSDGSARAAASNAQELSRSTCVAVRRLMHAYREGWPLDGRLTTAARIVTEDARERRFPAAQMLVALKQAWAALDEVRSISPTDSRELLGRLVTLSIEAYYGAASLAQG